MVRVRGSIWRGHHRSSNGQPTPFESSSTSSMVRVRGSIWRGHHRSSNGQLQPFESSSTSSMVRVRGSIWRGHHRSSSGQLHLSPLPLLQWSVFGVVFGVDTIALQMASCNHTIVVLPFVFSESPFGANDDLLMTGELELGTS